MSIDHVLRRIQGSATEHRVLAFADDLCLLASSPEELQDILDLVHEEMGRIGLHLNPAKSHSFFLSGETPVGVRDHIFHLGSDSLHPIEEAQFHKFLGKPVGFNPVPDYKKFNDIITCAERLMESLLAPWQKIDALVSFIYPALQFLMRTAQFKKEDWTLFDEALRKAIKDVLYLPDNAYNELLYGHRKSGCFGIPLAAEESDLNRIDTALKFVFHSVRVMANPQTLLETTSLLEHAIPSVTNSVILSPPREVMSSLPVRVSPSIVSSPHSPVPPSNSDCSIIVNDILTSPSPICKRTRKQLLLCHTATIAVPHDQTFSEMPLDLSPRRPVCSLHPSHVSTLSPVAASAPPSEIPLVDDVEHRDNSNLSSDIVVPVEQPPPSSGGLSPELDSSAGPSDHAVSGRSVVPPPRELLPEEVVTLQNIKIEKASQNPPPLEPSTKPPIVPPSVSSSAFQVDSLGGGTPPRDEHITPFKTEPGAFQVIPLEKQLELTPSPSQPSGACVETFGTQIQQAEVLYYPDSLRCRYCELVLSSPRSFHDHVRENLHFEKSLDVSTALFHCSVCHLAFDSVGALSSHVCPGLRPVRSPPKTSPARESSCAPILSPPSPAQPGVHGSGLSPVSQRPPVSYDPANDYACNTCGVAFPSEAHFLQHQCIDLQSQDPPSIQCTKCDFRAPTVNLVELHIFQVHSPVLSDSQQSQDRNVVRCLNCSKRFDSVSAKDSHVCVPPSLQLLPPSEEPVRNCPICNFVERGKFGLNEHIAKRHTCTLCLFVEHPGQRLSDHTKSVHSCLVCGFVETPNLSVSAHSKDRHNCKLCDFVEKKKTGLRFHMKAIHGQWAKGRNPVVRNLSSDLSVSASSDSLPALPSLPSELYCLGCSAKFVEPSLFTEHSVKCDKYRAILDAAKPPRVPSPPVFKCSSCPFVGKNGPALASHVLAKHPPATPASGHSDSDNPDDPASPIRRSPALGDNSAVPFIIPTASCRRGDSLHIVFPIFGKIDCTENNCSRPFANESWSSIKNSLKRHLEKDHGTRIRSSFFWCSVCKLRIGRSPTSHGCLQGKPVLPPSTPFHWKCDVCPSSFPSEAGLRNHKRMHKMNEIRDKGEQLVVAKPVFRGRRVPRLPDAVSSSAGDECVSDPALVIAQQVDCPGLPTPPDTQVNSEACLLDKFITDLKSICDQDPSDGAFTFLCVTYDQAIAEISSALLPPLRTSVSRNEPPRFDPLDAKEVQRLYKRNRPKAIREISGKSGERCALPTDQLEAYFTEAWDSQHVVSDFFSTDTSGRGCVLDSPSTSRK
ncbi:hypothetical protein AVEN_7644-1 [Araneus ventricosus]|uniref:C2H2-type domain-containing protein n=1 Tax=Araneus ventricosus TaxID=182803 RepID=A0A4Y2SYG8_ARAVE|nr:hypothetical protein AVEN_7644-1 [Araneus ventricosus]